MTPISSRSASVLLLLSAVAFGCADGTSPPPAVPAPPPAPPASAPAPAAAVPVPATWSKSMTTEEKIAFMKARVVPQLGPVFQGADPARYATFNCATCHGPANRDPHDFLPHLTMSGGKLTAFADKPDVTKFMAESVTPKMADAMGLPHFDRATHQGFGCPGCHTIDTK